MRLKKPSDNAQKQFNWQPVVESPFKQAYYNVCEFIDEACSQLNHELTEKLHRVYIEHRCFPVLKGYLCENFSDTINLIRQVIGVYKVSTNIYDDSISFIISLQPQINTYYDLLLRKEVEELVYNCIPPDITYKIEFI
jgi:hypothetical protein